MVRCFGVRDSITGMHLKSGTSLHLNENYKLSFSAIRSISFLPACQFFSLIVISFRLPEAFQPPVLHISQRVRFSHRMPGWFQGISISLFLIAKRIRLAVFFEAVLLRRFALCLSTVRLLNEEYRRSPGLTALRRSSAISPFHALRD
jgi:hypothetical protein